MKHNDDYTFRVPPLLHRFVCILSLNREREGVLSRMLLMASGDSATQPYSLLHMPTERSAVAHYWRACLGMAQEASQ